MSFLAPLQPSPSHAVLSRPSPPAARGRYTARLASDEATRLDAFRLRYDSYVDAGHLDPNPGREFRDRYDLLPNSRTVVLYDGACAVGSVRVCLLGRPGLVSPASETFPAELSRVLASAGDGGMAAEITRLVRSPAAADDQALVLLLYRVASFISHAERVRIALACVRRHHAPFYRRLGFTTVSEPKPYPGLTCPMALMACDLASHARGLACFPLVDPFAPGCDPLDGLLEGEPVLVSLFPLPSRSGAFGA